MYLYFVPGLFTEPGAVPFQFFPAFTRVHKNICPGILCIVFDSVCTEHISLRICGKFQGVTSAYRSLARSEYLLVETRAEGWLFRPSACRDMISQT